MAYLFAGINDYGSVALDLSAYSQITLSFLLWWDAFANDDDLALEHSANFGASSGFIVDPNSANVGFEFAFSLGGVNAWSDMFTRPTSAAWHHYMLTMNRSAPANQAWVDGTPQTLTTVVHGAATYGNFSNQTLYIMSRNNASLFGAGRLAELAIFGGLLGSDHAAQLASGRRANTLNVKPLSYSRMLRGGNDQLRSSTIGFSGAVVTDHPRIIPPPLPTRRRRRLSRNPSPSTRYPLIANVANVDDGGEAWDNLTTSEVSVPNVGGPYNFFSAGATSDWLQYTTVRQRLPAGVTITGIQAALKLSSSQGDWRVVDYDVLQNGSPVPSTATIDDATIPADSLTSTTRYVGSSTSLHGATWAIGDQIGFRFKVQDFASDVSLVLADVLTITIWYSDGSSQVFCPEFNQQTQPRRERRVAIPYHV